MGGRVRERWRGKGERSLLASTEEANCRTDYGIIKAVKQ